MHQDSNIIYFPKTKDQRLNNAVRLFAKDTADVALNEFESLIDDGFNEAYAFIAALYECGGNGVSKDYQKAKFYYEKSIESYGAVEGYIGLARIYYHGLGVERDYKMAVNYFHDAGQDDESGFSYYMLGIMHLNGLGVEPNIDAAKKYFEEAWYRKHVFGLTGLSMVEQQQGNRLKSIMLRIKAGWLAYRLAGKNINDPRIRTS